MTRETNQSEERLRPHPLERFEGDEHLFDLNEVINRLRAEPFPGERGHRQITIYKRPPVTQVLFIFKPGASLPDHRAQGLVTIHALVGQMTVRAEENTYELNQGSLVNLVPGVRHDVIAHNAAAMLLTVHLEDKTTA